MQDKNCAKSSNTSHFRDRANFLSHFLFLWELKVVYKKWQNKLTEEEFLIPPKSQESKNLGDQLEKNWEGESHFSKNPSLLRALIKTFGLEWAVTGVIFLITDLIVTLLRPFYLAKLLDCFTFHQTNDRDLFFYGSLVILLIFLEVLVLNYFLMEMSTTSCRVRIACTSLIYRKVFKLKKSTRKKISLGQILNVLTKDVEQYDFAFRFLHFIWIHLLKIPIVLGYLILVFDLSAGTGFVAFVAVAFIQMYTMAKMSSSKESSSVETDRKISLMGALIYKIQEIKMYNWERLFETRVKKTRNVEVEKIAKAIHYFLTNCSIEIERGVKLSGGQKARINLARAIYRNAEIYLLDDPLSAVDAHVANYIFNECILKYLKDKCVLLVTHQIQYLRNIESVYVLEKGAVVACGKYQDLEDLIGKSVVKSFEKCFDGTSMKLEDYEVPKETEESRGSTTVNPYKSYLIAKGRWITAGAVLFVLLLVEILIGVNNYFLSSWVNHKNGAVFGNLEDDLYNLYIYGGLVFIVIITSFTTVVLVKKHGSVVSTGLHDSLFKNILKSSMNIFNDHSSGRILNRFSRDVGVVDELIPQTLYQLKGLCKSFPTV